jgi:hypothetical protein
LDWRLLHLDSYGGTASEELLEGKSFADDVRSGQCHLGGTVEENMHPVKLGPCNIAWGRKKMSKIETKEAPVGKDKDGSGGIERCSLVSNTVSKVSSEDNRDAALLAKCLHL